MTMKDLTLKANVELTMAAPRYNVISNRHGGNGKIYLRRNQRGVKTAWITVCNPNNTIADVTISNAQLKIITNWFLNLKP